MAKMSNLAISLLPSSMNILCLRVKQLVDEAGADVDHHTIYHQVAKEFQLYDAKDLAPIWLSHVVEGIMRDVENKEFKV